MTRRGALMEIARRDLLLTLAGAACARPAFAGVAPWRAGVASVDITPPPGLWMAGYAARKEPAQGATQPLHAKALALRDGAERTVVIATLDVLGLTAPVVERIAGEVARRFGLPRSGLVLCSSHTHSGPVIDDQLAIAYPLTPAQWDAIRQSTRRIEGQVVEAVGAALYSPRPVRLRFGQASAGFAANRRTAFPGGPVDPAVPVLSIEREEGDLLGVLFGYACHNTTLPPTFVQYHGDYAGVAQAELERRHQGALALYVAGCGADANPSPRGTLELAEQHGRALADAVERAMDGSAAVTGRLDAAFGTAVLDYAPAPPADTWRARLSDENVYVRRHAALMLDVIAREGRVQAFERAPLHVVRIGQVTFVAISGEVVVDYSFAVKRLGGQGTWVAGCTDAVFGYLPSRRILREGGYEGGEAMLYYGRPGPFADTVEASVMHRIEALLSATRRSD